MVLDKSYLTVAGVVLDSPLGRNFLRGPNAEGFSDVPADPTL